MTHLTRETHGPDSQSTGGPLLSLHLHTRAANSSRSHRSCWGVVTEGGTASAQLPNLPEEGAHGDSASSALLPTHSEGTDRKGREFYIPLGLGILLNTPTRSPFQGWVTQLLRADGAALRHRCHEAWAGGTTHGCCSASSNLPPTSAALESANGGSFSSGHRDTPGSLLPWQGFRMVRSGAAA